ncbi:MBOAT family protein [candidate division GN15 bacterium]|nr:MBOAT family protein [candidate division GN15 bacterium]
MIFNSTEFLVFFILVLGAYWLLSRRLQNRFLLVASYVFYGAWDYRFLSLILLSTVVDYIVGHKLHTTEAPKTRKRLLAVSVAVNLAILGFFKYFNFFADSLQDLVGMVGYQFDPFSLSIVLPVGISFYTFQTMSYTIDIYNKKLEPSRNFLDFALFVAFFPQLVAGPIERAVNLLPQIYNKRSFSFDQFSAGIYLIVWGLFKKVVIADNLAITVERIFSQTTGFYGGEVLIGVLFFAFQIYCDFSGYSDIARGIAKTMGFELMVNFNLPYIARNPSDFWKRWHISLSSWLRDYLYIPLGGNRGSELFIYRNLILTMLLGGLWHGAAWNFVVWGLYHGSLLSVHRKFTELRARYIKTPVNYTKPLGWTVSAAVMFFFTLYGWLLFRAESFTQIWNMTLGLIPFGGLDPAFFSEIGKLLFYISILLIVQVGQVATKKLNFILDRPIAVQSAFYLACVYLVIILGAFDGPSFIYFQF